MAERASVSREAAPGGDLEDESDWEDVDDEEFHVALEEQALADTPSESTLEMQALEDTLPESTLHKPLTEFHLFPTFPLEIRQAIFRQAMPVPRLIGKQFNFPLALYYQSNTGSRI